MAFLLLGKPFILSLSLAVLAGIATGWIVTSWHSTEFPIEEKKIPDATEIVENEPENKKESKFQKRQQKRYRRQPQASWFFWKNPRRPPKKRR